MKLDFVNKSTILLPPTVAHEKTIKISEYYEYRIKFYELYPFFGENTRILLLKLDYFKKEYEIKVRPQLKR